MLNKADACQYHYDDTGVRILSVMKDNIDHPNKKGRAHTLPCIKLLNK